MNRGKFVYLHTIYQLTPNYYEEISHLHAARLHRVWISDNGDFATVETVQRGKQFA